MLLRFAQRTEPDVTLIDLADEALDALAAESGETINLAVPTPLGVEQLSQRDSRHFIGSTNWVGKRVPYHLTANGKVFLAWGAAASDHCTPEDLDGIRARGYATAIDELEVGLTALAAPVFGADGDPSRRSPSPAPPSASPAAASSSLRRRSSTTRWPSRASSATKTTSEEPHDARGDPPGPLRRDARRQRARGAAS